MLLIGCLVPAMIRVDGQLIPNDMLQGWRAVTMKRNLVGSSFAIQIAAEALIYLERGRRKAILE